MGENWRGKKAKPHPILRESMDGKVGKGCRSHHSPTGAVLDETMGQDPASL